MCCNFGSDFHGFDRVTICSVHQRTWLVDCCCEHAENRTRNQSFVHQHGLAYIAVSYESDSDEQLDAHLRTGTEFPFIKSHVRG